MSTAAVEIRVQAERVYPRKRLCAFTQNATRLHYFIAIKPNEIFCSDRCRRKDEMDRPR